MNNKDTTEKRNTGGRPVGLRKLPDGTYAMPESDGVTYISKKDGTVYRFEPKVKRHPGRQRGLRRRPDGTWGYDNPNQDPKNKVSIVDTADHKKYNKTQDIIDFIIGKKSAVETGDVVVDDADEPNINMDKAELRLRVYPIVQDDQHGMWGYTPKSVFKMFDTKQWIIVAPEAILIDGEDIYSPFFDALEMTDWWRIKKDPIASQGLKSYWLVMDDRNDIPLFIFTESTYEGSYEILNNGTPTGDIVYTESALIAFVPIKGTNQNTTCNPNELHGRHPCIFEASGLFRGNIRNTKENKDMYKGLVSVSEQQDADGVVIASVLSVSDTPVKVDMDAKIEKTLDEEEEEDESDDNESESEDEDSTGDSYYDYYDEYKIDYDGGKKESKSGNASSHATGYMPHDWEIGYTKKRGSASYSVSSEDFMQDLGDGARKSKTFSLSDDIDYNNDME